MFVEFCMMTTFTVCSGATLDLYESVELDWSYKKYTEIIVMYMSMQVALQMWMCILTNNSRYEVKVSLSPC